MSVQTKNSDVIWSVLSEDQARQTWDQALSKFEDADFHQSFSWGEYKREAGWIPLRAWLSISGTPAAMSQCLVKKVPNFPFLIAWIPGGPAYSTSSSGNPLNSLEKHLNGLKTHLSKQARFFVLRCNIRIPNDPSSQLVLRKLGFLRPAVTLSTGLTYVVDLSKSLEVMRDSLERNWRNQLKSAEKAVPTVEIGKDSRILERYLRMHNDMCRRKGLSGQQLTKQALERMVSILGDNIVFFLLSHGETDGCGCAIWFFEGKAYFGLSAATAAGREYYLPNAMYWEAIKYCKEKGKKYLDLTGIDPGSNWGVYNFKKGLGAPPVEHLGEWEFSNSPWVRRGLNLILWSRNISGI